MLKKIVMVGMVLVLTACGGGGGGGGGNVTPVALTVSGTASEGALILGKTVKLKDANGVPAVDTTTNATTGVYSIDVTGLTAPFLVTVTGNNGTYVTLAETAGTANINPITTTVVALAAGAPDVAALFTGLTPAQLAAIKAGYIAKSSMVTTSMLAALPTGVTAADYFTGTVTAGSGMDSVFDTYQITIHPTNGITVQTKGTGAATVLTIPAATVTANTSQPLPILTMPTANTDPVANAGTTQSVVTGTLVTLDGSGSSDANGDLLTYSWSVTSKPSGSGATLSSSTAVKPTFTADVAGSYVFSLVVNDGKVNSTAASVTVSASVANAAPVANAGTAQNVVTGMLVTLDGSASSDANGDALTYSWKITSKPSGSSASLSSAIAVKPTFTPDVAGSYVFSLVVNDGKVNSAAANVTVTVTVANAAPVANAGTAQNVVVGTLVTLDGSGSSDANGDLLTYSWSFTSKASGSSASLSSATAVKPTFTPDVVGTYVLNLVVNDGKVNSAAAPVSIMTIANSGSITIKW